MSSTAYHSARVTITTLTDQPLYFALRRADAVGYHGETHVYLADLSHLRLAAEREVVALRPSESPYTRAWEVLENHPEVQETLEQKGFHGARFADMGPDNSYSHDTVVVFRPKSAGVTLEAL